MTRLCRCAHSSNDHSGSDGSGECLLDDCACKMFVRRTLRVVDPTNAAALTFPLQSFVTAEDAERVGRLAKEQHVSVSEWVRGIVLEALARGRRTA